jgi:hypothetical protein
MSDAMVGRRGRERVVAQQPSLRLRSQARDTPFFSTSFRGGEGVRSGGLICRKSRRYGLGVLIYILGMELRTFGLLKGKGFQNRLVLCSRISVSRAA